MYQYHKSDVGNTLSPESALHELAEAAEPELGFESKFPSWPLNL